MGETKDHKYCWNLFSGDRDHVTALSGDHIISETKTVQSDGEAKENRMIYCIKKQSAITGRYSKKNKQD